MDSDYACEIFTSCKLESFISQSGISSSLAFLDFLGVNGQNSSLSIITFDLTKNETLPESLTGEAVPCEYQIPADNTTLEGFTDINNCSCSHCSASCQAPAVDAEIAFLDGLSWKVVGYSYLGFILFTVAFQLIVHFCCVNKSSGLVDPQTERATGGRLNNTTMTSGNLSGTYSGIEPRA